MKNLNRKFNRLLYKAGLIKLPELSDRLYIDRFGNFKYIDDYCSGILSGIIYTGAKRSDIYYQEIDEDIVFNFSNNERRTI